MSSRIWFNARVLCCEAEPVLQTRLKEARARVRLAPWSGENQDWSNPDYPFALVEGHDVVLVRWPSQGMPEQVRWWVGGTLSLIESARRYRVKALGFQLDPAGSPLLVRAGEFLEQYLKECALPTLVTRGDLLAELEQHFALAKPQS